MKRTLSKQYVNPVPATCTFCGAYTVPRQSAQKEGTTVVKECRWICPRCNAVFRTGLVK